MKTIWILTFNVRGEDVCLCVRAKVVVKQDWGLVDVFNSSVSIAIRWRKIAFLACLAYVFKIWSTPETVQTI